MLDEFFKKLVELIAKATSTPWAQTSIAIIVVVTLAAILFFVVNRIRKGDDFNFLWIIQLKPNRIVEQQKTAFDNLNEDAKQKAQVIKILNQVAIETARVLNSDTGEEYIRNKKSVYDYILYSIGVVITKQKSNNHRVAIFVKDTGGQHLLVHEGVGYSSEGKLKLRLDIHNSAAGYTFRTGEIFHSGDVTAPGSMFRIHPKATKSIKSLMCVPIKCDNMTLGVLSIDGQEENSFTKDDQDYMTYFANALTSLMLMEYIYDKRGEGGAYDQVSSGKAQG
jgi:transcriptional regulator with GAF, ATPase, and Fis domain